MQKNLKHSALTNQEACLAFEAILANPHAQIFAAKDLITSDDAEQIKQQEIAEKKSLTLLEKIKLVWCNVLGIEDIKDEDDFFDLGGDSLTAIQASYKLKKEYNIESTPSSLLERSNIKDFAESIKS